VEFDLKAIASIYKRMHDVDTAPAQLSIVVLTCACHSMNLAVVLQVLQLGDSMLAGTCSVGVEMHYCCRGNITPFYHVDASLYILLRLSTLFDGVAGHFVPLHATIVM
jgi:hypothetical protein